IGDDSDSITQAAKYGDSTRTSDKSNKAGGSGGAFYFANASGGSDKFAINLYGGTIAYNCAANNGGAFYLKSGNLTVQGAQIKYNGASGDSDKGGGAIFLDACSKLHLDGCTIAGNECYNSAMGGAIYVLGDYDTARTPKTFLKGAVSIPSNGLQKNDICLKCYNYTGVWLQDPLLYIEGTLTGSEPVATITIAPVVTMYRSDRQVLALADGVTDVNFPLQCYKFAVTPQASVSPAQEWAVAGDGYLAPVTTLTGTSIDGFTVADFNEGDKVIYVFDASVNNTQIEVFTEKLYHKTTNNNPDGKTVGEGSVLDFSKVTNLTSLGFNWSNNSIAQPFDIILPPKFDATKFTGQTFATSIRNAKNVIATPMANGGLVSEDGIVYNKPKTTLFFYPGGKTATSFVVPNGVTTIPRHSFSCNSSLKNITLPEGVTSIAWETCWGTSIESINVPSTVKTIANEAFSNSASFTSLTFANPNGWKLGPDQSTAVEIAPSNLSDPTTAATWYKANAYNVSGATNSNGYKVLWHD
ncbi:MAG: leucine-rich repeat domain-containing protein, partial [Treponema sp.]|nr:leucine-rich repeat domain-containing protein [Treponema sp.]